jgi:trehalose-6-phosphate synthase
LSEGQSLIAKEYVACREDDQGMILLSKRSGSVSELGQGAIVIDPADKQDFARGILEAFSMSKEEKRRRMLLMKRIVSWNSLQDWAVRFLGQVLTTH